MVVAGFCPGPLEPWISFTVHCPGINNNVQLLANIIDKSLRANFMDSRVISWRGLAKWIIEAAHVRGNILD